MTTTHPFNYLQMIVFKSSRLANQDDVVEYVWLSKPKNIYPIINKVTHIVLIIMTQKVVTLHYFVKVYINYFQENSIFKSFQIIST